MDKVIPTMCQNISTGICGYFELCCGQMEIKASSESNLDKLYKHCLLCYVFRCNFFVCKNKFPTDALYLLTDSWHGWL